MIEIFGRKLEIVKDESGNCNRCALSDICPLGLMPCEDSEGNINRRFENVMSKPKDISEFLQRLTTEEQEFLWEHIEKVKKEKREEIMKGAIEAEVENGAFYGVKPEIRIRPESGYKTGDKVRVLIIKHE